MNTSVCTAAFCQQAASQYLANLSPNYKNIDPCTDFETYVCEGFRLNHTIPPEKSSIGSFSLIDGAGNAILRKVLENPYPRASNHSHFSPRNLAEVTVSLDEENFNQLQRNYNACMDTSRLEKQGMAPLNELIKGLTDTFDNSTTWMKTMLYLEPLGISPFLSIYVDADPKSPVSLAHSELFNISSK